MRSEIRRACLSLLAATLAMVGSSRAFAQDQPASPPPEAPPAAPAPSVQPAEAVQPQAPAAPQPAATDAGQPAEPAEQPEVQQAKLTPEELDELTGPIALYPDPLVAQILPASTYPTDIVLAARLVRNGATEEQINAQDWDPSVKAVAHYQTVIAMMDENLDWTQRLGLAFLAQPEDVMASIQQLRVKAKSLGNLPDTPQQSIIVEQEVIRIVPSQPEIVYVPVYQPTVIYERACYQPGYITSPYYSFSVGYRIGHWLDLDCDWHYRRCYYPVGWSWHGYRHGVTNIYIGGGHRHWDHGLSLIHI